MKLKPSNDYLLGHAPNEQQRVIDQAQFIDKLTRQVFRDAGLRQGMHVLAAGCGVVTPAFLHGVCCLHAQALELDATLTLFSFVGAWSRA
jgi:hypothetical protein